MDQITKSLRRGCLEKGLLFFAETLIKHLLGGGVEAALADIIHGDEAESLGERDSFGAFVQEFDLGAHLAVHSVEHHLADAAVSDGSLGKNCGAAGERETLDDANKTRFIHLEQCAFLVGYADALSPLLARPLWLLGHACSMASAEE